MAVTQIVSVSKNKEALKDSLKKMSTDRVVFLASNENIKEVIKIRNEFALETKLPTEIKAVARNYSSLAELFKERKNSVVHIIDHDYFNYGLVNAAFIVGVPVYLTNGHGLEKVPSLNLKLKDLISSIQIELLEKLEESPLTIKELALKLDVDENMLYYYLHGSKSLKGLVNLGLVKEGDMIELTDLGRLVIES